MNILWAKSLLEELAEKKFTGRVEFNFFQGGIPNANRMECLKPPEEKKEVKFDRKTAERLKEAGY